MKRKTSARLICLIVAAVMLSGAVAYAAVMGSPYETLKRAVLDAATYRNVTIEGHVTMSVDGVVQSVNRAHSVNGDNGSLSYYFDENGNRGDFRYYANSLIVHPTYTATDGTIWYYANVYPQSPHSSYAYSSSFFIFGSLSSEERDSASLRFAELLIDALVGDLKNNVTMTSGDGVRLIRGTLTENQVPELAKAGLDVLVEQSGRYHSSRRDVSFDGTEYIYEHIRIVSGMKTVVTWSQNVRRATPEEEQDMEDGTFYTKAGHDFYGFSYIDGITYLNDGPDTWINEYTVPATRDDYKDRDPLEVPMKSLAINYVHGEAEIDMNGNLLGIDLSGAATLTNIFGDVHAVDVNASVSFSDIGTSNPVCPIPGAEQLLTPEYAKTHFGSEYMGIYFKLNPDGSIDADSVSTTFPGEMDRDVEANYVLRGDGFSTAYPYLSSSITVNPYPVAASGPFPVPDPARVDIAVVIEGED